MFVVLKSCDKSWLLRFTFLVAKGANVGFFFLIVMLYSYQLMAAHKVTVQLSNPINKTIKGCQFRDTFMVKILTEDASLNLLPNNKGFQRVSNKPALFDKPKKSYVVWQDAGYTWHKSSGNENANVIGITYARYGEELNSCLCFTTAGEKREKKWLNRRNGVTAGMVAMGSSTIAMLAHCWSGGVGGGATVASNAGSVFTQSGLVAYTKPLGIIMSVAFEVMNTYFEVGSGISMNSCLNAVTGSASSSAAGGFVSAYALSVACGVVGVAAGTYAGYCLGKDFYMRFHRFWNAKTTKIGLYLCREVDLSTAVSESKDVLLANMQIWLDKLYDQYPALINMSDIPSLVKTSDNDVIAIMEISSSSSLPSKAAIGADQPKGCQSIGDIIGYKSSGGEILVFDINNQSTIQVIGTLCWNNGNVSDSVVTKTLGFLSCCMRSLIRLK